MPCPLCNLRGLPPRSRDLKGLRKGSKKDWGFSTQIVEVIAGELPRALASVPRQLLVLEILAETDRELEKDCLHRRSLSSEPL